MSASVAAKVPARAKRGHQVTPEGKKERVALARRGTNTSNNAGAALVDPEKPLTTQQRTFVKLWAQGESIPNAAHLAGYSDGATYAYRMVRMPNILKLYAEEKAAYERDSSMTRAKVIEGFMDGIEMARMLGEPSSMISGWREVGKMCGYYEPVKVRHEISVEGKVMVERMENMSDDELMKLIEQRAAAMRQAIGTTVQAITEGVLDDDADRDGDGA